MKSIIERAGRMAATSNDGAGRLELVQTARLQPAITANKVVPDIIRSIVF